MSYTTIQCDSIIKLIEEVMRLTQEFEGRYGESALPFFRGHSSTDYQLLPGFFRPADGVFYQSYDEKNFFYEFRARAGALLNPSYSSWDILFLMQHHGLPTRLLDWTESFAAALFFALGDAEEDIDLWMLNPYDLNASVTEKQDIINVDLDLGGEYNELFLEGGESEKVMDRHALAIYPRRQIARLASQHGLFTLHFSPRALESLEAPWLTRLQLSASATEEARTFLKVMGVNEFSLFPDLDGLSRFLKERIRGGYGLVA